jgi:hypothetical protein
MAQIQAPYTFVTGDQITAANLNAHTNSAILLPGSITDQPNITANTVVAGDSVALHDLSDLTLKEATVGDLLNSGLGITTGAIAGVTGANLVITPAATFALSVAGNLSTTANFAVTGTSTLAGLTVSGNASFSSVEAIKIPVGTTAQRPTSPVTGQFRYNSTLGDVEVYDGTLWKAVGGGPFDATGGGITTVDGYKIHTFIASGTFTPDTTKEGKVEVLVVGAGGSGAYFNPQGGGGGGGGDVKSGFLNIPKGQAPMAVTVGTNTSGSGTPSSFATFFASGGTSGSGRSGGTSGSGIAGGGPGDGGGAGGGAKSGEILPRLGNAGGFGGRGVGSFISGSYQEYGGGGGGSGGGVSGFSQHLLCSPEGIYGGGGRGVAPASNSGGGGGGGGGSMSATAGANGVVIIRYRVS